MTSARINRSGIQMNEWHCATSIQSQVARIPMKVEHQEGLKLQCLTSICRVLRLAGSMRVRTFVTLVHSRMGKMLPELAANFGGRHTRSSCRRLETFAVISCFEIYTSWLKQQTESFVQHSGRHLSSRPSQNFVAAQKVSANDTNGNANAARTSTMLNKNLKTTLHLNHNPLDIH